MPDFSVRATSGVTVENWTDAPSATKPSRLNAAGIPYRYLSVAPAETVVFKATPDGGAEGDDDSLLDGRLFSSWFGERPQGSSATLVPTVGYSSIVSFTPHTVGHYMVVFRRPGGGAVGVHIDCE